MRDSWRTFAALMVWAIRSLAAINPLDCDRVGSIPLQLYEKDSDVRKYDMTVLDLATGTYNFE